MGMETPKRIQMEMGMPRLWATRMEQQMATQVGSKTT